MMRAGTVLAVALMCFSAPVAAMEAMSAGELAQVTGREGINVGLELRINADANGDPLTGAANLANCASSTDFSSIGCRLAVKFANREDGGGEWLVFKNFSGILKAPGIFLDASRTSASATPYEDLSRFRDEDGAPLISTPHDTPAIAFTFKEPVEFGLTIGGINVEYGATGYLNNANDPFMGVKVGDAAGGSATLNIEGTMSWFGF